MDFSIVFKVLLAASLVISSALILFHRGIDRLIHTATLRLLGVEKGKDGRYRYSKNGHFASGESVERSTVLTYRIFWHLVAPAIAFMPVGYVIYVSFLN